MAISMAELIILSLLVDWGFRKLKIPGLVGMLIVGVITGPYVLQIMKPELSTISSDLRMIALIVILLRAGFELSKETLSKVGFRAMLLSCVPAIFEGAAIVWFGHAWLHLSYMESAILGSVLAAVSPAVVVPLMIQFMEQKKGTDKGIPTLVLAASSIDDVFVIVVYTVLIGMYTGQQVNITWKIAGIPISILLGIGIGLICGFGLYHLFERFNPRATKRILIILGVSIFLVNVEHLLEDILPFAALLAVMAIGVIILEKSEHMAHEISAKLTRLWVFAEILLFTLVGAQVNLKVAVDAGLVGILLIGLALVARSIGTYLCLIRSHLTLPERGFVVIAYLPKATVQAAIGGTPLLAMKLAGMETQPGEIILAIAVLSILVTAPVGAWAISIVGARVLEPAQSEQELREKGRQITRDDVIAALRTTDVMYRDVIIIRADEKVRRVVEYFAGNDFVLYPVIDASNALSGIIRLDNLQHLLASQETWEWLVAKDVATPLPHKIFSTSPLSEALTIMQAARLEQIPVIEEDSGKVVGMLDAHHAEKLIEQKLIEENITQ
jgi:NhaP-type Na+/H+ or K+/H+ antiporter